MFTAPLFSAFCSLAAYGLVKECRDTGAGLAAAALVGMVPSYISRSVAGSYDNEGVAIFALVFVFYTFIKVCWATLCPAGASIDSLMTNNSNSRVAARSRTAQHTKCGRFS